MAPTTFSASNLRTIEVFNMTQRVLDDLRILRDLMHSVMHSETSISASMAASLDAIYRSARAIQIVADPATRSVR